MVGFEYFFADIRTFRREFYVVGLVALFDLLFQFVKRVNARFCFGSTGLRLPAHPVELFAVDVLCAVSFGILYDDAFTALFQVIGIIAFVGVDLTIVNFDDLRTYPIEKIAVVGNHQ